MFYLFNFFKMECSFRNPSRLEVQKYGELLNLDFNYFSPKFSENFERKLEAEPPNGQKNELKVMFLTNLGLEAQV